MRRSVRILGAVVAVGAIAGIGWIGMDGPRKRGIDSMFHSLCPYWPPRSVVLVAFKEERRLEVWGDGRWMKSYPILAASGSAGPKRREGDRQVPEGVYQLTTLNSQSRFHLSIRVDYPDAEDSRNGCTGSDIYVHGGAVSVGCIAIGNEAIEEIYRLSEHVVNRWIIIVPWDLRRKAPPVAAEPWLNDRYARLSRELEAYK